MDLQKHNNNSLPPFIKFSVTEPLDNNDIGQAYYDPETQKSIFPYGMGSQKKVTKSAKNVGNILIKKWKNVNDDAKEK